MSIPKNDVHYHHPDHLLIALACVIFLAVIIGYMMGRSTMSPTPPMIGNPEIQRSFVQCTADAMICPDGTTVTRTGPNCDFAPCP